jgi:hypothetical protein
VPSAARGGHRFRWLALGLLGALLVLSVAASVVREATAPELVALTAVTEPATALEGWAPVYADATGRPARWDPCTPIPYVVQTRWMPYHGRRDLTEALRRISAVSGLRFVDRGDTDEVPSRDRQPYQPERYGEQWAPLLIAWVPSSGTDLDLAGDVQGLAVPVAVPGTGSGHLVTGQVALDADTPLPSGFGPGATEGEVLLHELTHAIGLGHVDDATQVMHVSTTNSESTFGRGDRAGLAAVGREAGCHPAPRPSDLG